MKSAAILCMTTALAASMLACATARADERAPAALTGQVTSDAEGAMEGVVVTARKDGSIVSTSVTTDAKGQYAFPENRLEPGRYTVTIRA
ncbi:MAG: carboxypeptidase-like regulatory domain-containing protein, partial [Xanthobacteraceae bacterium]